MNIQNISNSVFGAYIGLFIGRYIPTKAGYSFSRFLAIILSKRISSPLIQAVRNNQWMIHNGDLSPSDLNQAVINVLTHAGRCFIDLYHNFDDKNKIMKLVKIDQKSQEIINLSKDPSFGAFVVTAHLSNFDFALLGLAVRGLTGCVLSYANPTSGYKIQNKLRTKTGLEINPIDRNSIKNAIINMQNGGFVYTGIERPVAEKTKTLTFFGHPSPLPTGHIRMASKANVPIIVATAWMDSDGYYHIDFSEPIPIQSFNNTDEMVKVNGERILQVIVERILAHPDQWLMYYPVWPHLEEIH